MLNDAVNLQNTFLKVLLEDGALQIKSGSLGGGHPWREVILTKLPGITSLHQYFNVEPLHDFDQQLFWRSTYGK